MSTEKDKKYTYTPHTYKDFAESDATKDAWGKKTDYDNKVANYGSFVDPTEYEKYQQMWKDREKFSYDFNTDAIYQQYKDKYIQQGKMAMADTIGQASAMTGGYGNSYAATVGNQAYQSHLQQLNDVIPELYQMAYDRYNQEGQDLLNTISMLKGDRDFAYGQWGDEYNKLLSQQQYWGDMYLGLYDRDYGVYSSDRTYDQTEHNNSENAAYNTYRDEIEDAQWEKTYGLSERELKMAEEAWELQKKSYNSGGSGSGSYSSGSGSGSGGFSKAIYARDDDYGNKVFYIDGKERTFAPGVNPYNGNKNSDVKHGTFSNGYQPNNIGGKKLSKTGDTDVVNGVRQNVWQTPDGTKWIWDGTQNRYLKYVEPGSSGGDGKTQKKTGRTTLTR